MSGRCHSFLVRCFTGLIVCAWIPGISPEAFYDESPPKNFSSRLHASHFENTEGEGAKNEEGRHVRLGDHNVLCEVIKKHVEFKISGTTHKPDSLMFYACRGTESGKRPPVQELIDLGSDREDREFCWISRERGPPKCETQHQQVAVFSREFGSGLWSYQNVHVPAGCGCHLGLKHFN